MVAITILSRESHQSFAVGFCPSIVVQMSHKLVSCGDDVRNISYWSGRLLISFIGVEDGLFRFVLTFYNLVFTQIIVTFFFFFYRFVSNIID